MSNYIPLFNIDVITDINKCHNRDAVVLIPVSKIDSRATYQAEKLKICSVPNHIILPKYVAHNSLHNVNSTSKNTVHTAITRNNTYKIIWISHALCCKWRLRCSNHIHEELSMHHKSISAYGAIDHQRCPMIRRTQTSYGYNICFKIIWASYQIRKTVGNLFSYTDLKGNR